MFLTTIVFIAILGVLVLAHEFGHFIIARKMGVKVDEFAIGFPPRIFGIYKNRAGKWIKVFGNKKVEDVPTTLYALHLIPLGGFCKIKGEDGEKSVDEDSFVNKKIWQKSSILVAGVTMNFLLCAILFSIGFMIGLPQAVDSSAHKVLSVKNTEVQIISIAENSPAQKNDIKFGDVILSVNGNKVNSAKQASEFISKNGSKEIILKIKRNNQEMEKKIIPKKINDSEKAKIGVAMVDEGIVSYPFLKSIYMGFATTIKLTKTITVTFYNIIIDWATGKKIDTDVAGPVGIAVLTGQMVNMGFIYVLEFAALLSLNLAIINILPIPALDGGRLLFLAFEKIRGRAMSIKLENTLNNTGFTFLILLVILVTVRDFARLDFFAGLWGKISGLF
ncbi:MAG: RIP metalloprotease RseP [Xanthomonadaceae bacterium]|nr:RIP metalloprotease RseP [Rhodospirillaceae bacterium]NIA17804.1 RIP metalloprotease RseP [Xanthomonadaceae bacterium]